jgi:hypothetical protein
MNPADALTVNPENVQQSIDAQFDGINKDSWYFQD